MFGILTVIQASSASASIMLYLTIAVLFLGSLGLDITKKHIRLVSDFPEILKIKSWFMKTFQNFREDVVRYCIYKFNYSLEKGKNESKNISKFYNATRVQ